MSKRNLIAWLIVCAFLGSLFACTGCASVEESWYGCNTDTWKGWEFAKQCVRIEQERRRSRGLV